MKFGKIWPSGLGGVVILKKLLKTGDNDGRRTTNID